MKLAGRDTEERSPFPEVVCYVVCYIPREFSQVCNTFSLRNSVRNFLNVLLDLWKGEVSLQTAQSDLDPKISANSGVVFPGLFTYLVPWNLALNLLHRIGGPEGVEELEDKTMSSV